VCLEHFAEASDERAQLMRIGFQTWSLIAALVDVALQPFEIVHSSLDRAPRQGAAGQARRQPKLRAFAQPLACQVAEVDDIAPVRLMFALRDARIELRVPYVEFPPLTAVVGVNENVL
jgi:hypothetical protein